MGRESIRARQRLKALARRRTVKSPFRAQKGLFKVQGRIGGGFVSDGENADPDETIVDPHSDNMLGRNLGARGFRNRLRAKAKMIK